MSRRLPSALHLLLVLALAWVQLAGLVHGVGHGLTGERVAGLFQVPQAGNAGEPGNDQTGDKGGQASHACPDCLAYSALGAALSTSHALPPETAARESFLVLPGADFAAPRLWAYRSRAPPDFS